MQSGVTVIVHNSRDTDRMIKKAKQDLLGYLQESKVIAVSDWETRSKRNPLNAAMTWEVCVEVESYGE